jgi:hypothetical protein
MGWVAERRASLPLGVQARPEQGSRSLSGFQAAEEYRWLAPRAERRDEREPLAPRVKMARHRSNRMPALPPPGA